MTASHRSVLLIAALAGSMLITACGATARTGKAGAGPSVTDAGSAPSATPAPSSLDGCLTAGPATIEAVSDAYGGTLAVATIGTGPRVVVLSNESDEDLCSWLPFAGRLVRSGYRVVLWDYGGSSPADELMKVVRHIRSSGTSKIVLMGASEGAKSSLVAAAQITPMVQGIVSLSAESVLQADINVIDYVRRLHCRLFLLTASRDIYGSAQVAPLYLRAAPSLHKRLLTVPGTDHGTALLAGRSGRQTVPAILSFLRRALR